MDPAVRNLIDQPWPHLKRYQEIGAMLPQDDAELDRWIAELVEKMDPIGFMMLCISALGANRHVDARHLAKGAGLVNDGTILASFAWHMQGDAVAPLLEATSDERLVPGFRAMAIFIVVALCQERRGGVFPPEAITRARVLCRRKERLHRTCQAALYGIAAVTRDEGVASILELESDFQWEKAELLAETLKKAGVSSPLDLVITDPNPALGVGFTMRRAVPRIGRNEPCPCKSGRKYKNCCMSRDLARLNDSSHVEGVSQSDLRANPEPYLTLERLRRSVPHEFLRYDPRKIAEPLREDFFVGLFAYSLYDRAIECLELLGFPEALDGIAGDLLFMASMKRRTDAIRKLLAVHPRSAELQEGMAFGIKLAIAEDDPPRFLEVMEEGALEALRSDDDGHVQLFAYSWLHSRLPATGIFVARAAMQTIGDEHAQDVLEQIEVTRDQLGLSPDDPAGDLLEKRLLESTRAASKHDSKESRALAETRERLDAKAREVASLRESLETLRRDVKRRESRPPAEAASAETRSAPSPAPKAGDAPDERALQDLRFKVQKLKGELKDRHEERLALRQELRQARAKLEEKPAPAADDADDAEAEEEHVLPSDAAQVQPLRLPEYPRKFREHLESLPRHVARNALAAIGRLAGGELAAFSGVVRLKACPDVYRQRIGIDHRLLFRLTPDRLIVIDLIPRQDFERRIKSLLAGG